MNPLSSYQFICGLFPPILSQAIRARIFPLQKARKLNLEFSKIAITGSTFYGNTSDDHSYRFAIHGFFDWRNIVIAKGFTKRYMGDIIEVGANVGTETISFCDLISPHWNVYAFEPLPDNFKSLQDLAKNLDNLKVYQKAISNKTATVNFQIPPRHESGIGKIISISNDDGPTNTMEVEALPLNFYFNKFKKISLISIDTEGHEPYVLEGSKEIIDKFRPAVIIEVNSKLLKKYSNSSPDDIFNYFKNMNYLCFTINRFSLNELTGIISPAKKAQNWLCVPKEKESIIKSIKRDLLLRAVVPWYFLSSLKSSAGLN